MKKEIILCVFLALGCVRNEIQYSEPWMVRVCLEPGVIPIHRLWIASAMSSLDELGGPKFSFSEGRCEVTVRMWHAPECDHMAAYHITGTREIYIDPRCAVDELQFRTLFQHEIGHFLGMMHICTAANERPVCSPVGFGEAVMNPAINFQSFMNLNGLRYIHRTPWQPTYLDRLEFQRVMHGRNR
jgi:hypothetical protein